jgi:NADPH-dependent curcumin reductase CurA
MELTVRSIHVANKNQAPYFELKTYPKKFASDAVLVKVLTFSVDPIMKVWLSGAKTNFRTVSSGDIFNCFGLG